MSTAAHRPSDRHREVAIVMGPLWETWSAHDIERRSLGGTETAAVRVAQGLAHLDHNVAIYGEVGNETVEGVAYRHISTFEPRDRRLAVIVSRHPQYFDHPINAQTSMFWMHDPSYQDRLTPRRSTHIDYLLALNRWHSDTILKRYPFISGKLRTIRNGLELDYFQKSPGCCSTSPGQAPQRRRRVIYSSAPYRGIDVLLELWPHIHARVPDAELVYCHSDVYNSLADIHPGLGEHRRRLHELTKDTEGAQALGPLPQQELAQLLLDSLVWAHPSWETSHNRPFYETCPIAALEAQAAGCVVVASKWGGLQEEVKVGRLIDAEAPGERWRHALVEGIVDGLTNPETQAWAQTQGPEMVAGLGWHDVARHVAALIEGAPHPGRYD